MQYTNSGSTSQKAPFTYMLKGHFPESHNPRTEIKSETARDGLDIGAKMADTTTDDGSEI